MPQRRPAAIAIRFLLVHIAVGYVLASLLVLALFWADPGGVGHLLRREPSHPWPALLLWFFCGLTLSGVQMALAVMLEGRPPDDDGPGGGSREMDLELIPIPVARGR